MKQVLILCALPLILFADIFSQATQLSKTLNMGNYLEAPAEGDWGEVLVAEDFTRIALKGFTAIRVPIRWSAHIDELHHIDSAFFARVTWVITEARKNGLVTIIDDHHFEALMEDPDTYEPALLSIWEQISIAYQDIPDDSLFFEPLNEPHTNLTSERWNQLYPQLVHTIRRTNPTRPIIIGTTEWGGISGLFSLELIDDPYLIVTIHYYEPFQFTHQGAEWVDNSDPWLGTTWRGTFLEKRMINNHFQAIATWQEENNVPIFVGEFGAYNKADHESRLLWTHYCARLCESYGFPWAYWEYSSGFGLFDPSNQSWRRELTDTLLSDDTTVLVIDDSTDIFGENHIQNANFTATLAPWYHNVWGATADASFEILEPSGVLHHTEAIGSEWYQIQLLQQGISLHAGSSYLLQVTVSGDSGTISAGVMDQKNQSLGSSPALSLSGSTRTVETIITPDTSYDSATAVINLGYSTGDITIHSASLRAVQEVAIQGDISAQNTPTKHFSVKNRAIHFSAQFPDSHRLFLYSLRGQRIMEHTISTKTVPLPHDMSSGWYALIVKEGNREVLRSSFMYKE